MSVTNSYYYGLISQHTYERVMWNLSIINLLHVNFCQQEISYQSIAKWPQPIWDSE